MIFSNKTCKARSSLRNMWVLFTKNDLRQRNIIIVIIIDHRLSLHCCVFCCKYLFTLYIKLSFVISFIYVILAKRLNLTNFNTARVNCSELWAIIWYVRMIIMKSKSKHKMFRRIVSISVSIEHEENIFLTTIKIVWPQLFFRTVLRLIEHDIILISFLFFIVSSSSSFHI